MTSLSADTAEVPAVVPLRVLSPVPRHPAASASPGPAVPHGTVATGPSARRPVRRSEVVAERQALRRSRRRWGLAGLAVLGSTLGATVVVLDVFH